MKKKSSFRAHITGVIVVIVLLLLTPKLLDKWHSRAVSVEKSAELAGQYLINSINEAGVFAYTYDPKEDDVEEGYNILRHAGTTYSMLELYAKNKDPELLAASERGLLYLSQQVKPCPVVPTARCIEEDGFVKTGGNALAIIAFVEYAKATGNKEYIDEAEMLARWIQATQASTGEFTGHKRDITTNQPEDFVSDYYPGEAILSLLRLYNITNDPTLLSSAERGSQWLINVRDGGKAVQGLEHDHWLLYALNELYDHRPQALYSDHAFKITDAIVTAQIKEAPGRETWVGGYPDSGAPRSTPAATRTEGLIAAYKIAEKTGDEERTQVIFGAIERGIIFQMTNQYTPGSVRELGYSKRAIGGFMEGADDRDIRIDFVQHNLSALLGYIALKDAQVKETGS